ncbi:SDR family NAD(P)-dependent oxidoreductase [Aminobacter anthyllidis]|uniref:SDR family NAD(P)-dependent oxidoreductase n=1 Tax=Aminobacter anthyllidis TaxID=1035067 RepID=UPI002455A24A|nr:SDR family NAD(P)-dependent oxidoreductase [Aminobacter anthyllidis]MDH4984689.1 SDR family NAD(P)-dependent oxidoreductase [Aminobacter anthyllidis]
MSVPSTVVIGMGPGLGQALVKKFAREGHRVAFVGRRAEAIARYEHELRSEGLDVAGFVGDAGKPKDMDRVHASIREQHGDADVLLYNAAIIEPARFVTPSRMDEVKYGTADGWRSHGEAASFDYVVDAFRTNVAGALHAAQAVAPRMIERGRGTILLTGGVLAFGPWIEWGVTSLGKAALRSLGHSLEKELSPAGIQVSTVAIHGTMQARTPYDHDLIADAYWNLHVQPREQWSPDFHFRADAADGGDPDA